MYHRTESAETNQESIASPTGIKKKREWTDVYCLVIFSASFLVFLYSFFYGWTKGEVDKLGRPVDGDGNLCGSTSIEYDLSTFKYLYFNLGSTTPKELHSIAVCVERCPTGVVDEVPFYPTSTVRKEDRFMSTKSFLLWNRFCLPDDNNKYKTVGASFFSLYSETLYMTIHHYLPFIATAWFLSLVFSFGYSKLVGYCSSIIVYLNLTIVLALLTTGSISSWINYKGLKNQSQSSPENERGDILQSANSSFWLALIMWGSIAFLLILTFVLFRKIQMSIRIIQAAADFLADTNSCVLVPICCYLLSIFFLCIWLFTGFAIYSSSPEIYSKTAPWLKHKPVGLSR